VRLEGVSEMKNRSINETYKSQQRVSFVSMLIDSVDAVFIAGVSILSGSFLIALDAFESASNAIQDALTYSLSKRMQKDSSFKYDYGMGKIDAFGSFMAAMFMYVGLAAILGGSIYTLTHLKMPGELLFFAIFIKIYHIAVDIVLLVRQLKVAKREGNSPMVASAVILQKKSLIMDVVVFVSVTLEYVLRTLPHIEYFEPIVCIGCVAYIAIQNTKQIKKATSDLLDKTLDEETQMKILKCFSKIYPHIADFSGIRTRRSGSVIYIDLLVSFEDSTTYSKICEAYSVFNNEIQEVLPGSVTAIITGEVR
jgi:divalent metal cation (Fe/Co/Zn/Cd) transporter